MDRPYFEPQVGSNYRNGGIFGKRILVLGDIHYCNGSKNCACLEVSGGLSCNSGFTKEVISEYLEEYYGNQGCPTTMKKI